MNLIPLQSLSEAQEPAADFDWAAIDAERDFDPSAAIERQSLVKLMAWIDSARDPESKQTRLKFIRACIESQSLSSVARELHLSREAISKIARKFYAEFGFKSITMRSQITRQKLANLCKP